ncbi:LarC family nickel insertion protein [Gracilibacillus marinus]|uniref:LarC family nickel insertion protein n=1 Tax=Gracilibacillus marinus TaxID=630535 RepID=A0ABV8VPH5_9BACI
MTKTLYLDCFSGISGDMTVAALLATGVSFDELQEELKKLGMNKEYELIVKQVNKNGITSYKFDVLYEESKHADHHHSHEHSHHHDSDTHEHSHSHYHGHSHHHSHEHHHHHRTYKDIVSMINESELSNKTKEMALEMFKGIGQAEAKIHGQSLDDVHFHEVGAIDSIIDIVSVAILIDKLEIEKVIASHIPVGSGHIHIDHGTYPVPAPATLEILKGVPIKKSSLKGELTTPTGAAIIKVLVKEFSLGMPDLIVSEIGYGAGTKTFKEHPNVLRAVIGTSK